SAGGEEPLTATEREKPHRSRRVGLAPMRRRRLRRCRSSKSRMTRGKGLHPHGAICKRSCFAWRRQNSKADSGQQQASGPAMPEGAGTNPHGRLGVSDMVASRVSGMGPCTDTVQPDMTAYGGADKSTDCISDVNYCL